MGANSDTIKKLASNEDNLYNIIVLYLTQGERVTMKKLFLCAVLGVFSIGCASSQKVEQAEEASANNVRYQIVDQEYENLVVPNDHYDRVSSYEAQVNGASYIQSNAAKKTKKPGVKMNVKKTVVDANGNVLPSDIIAPVTDEEVLPEYDMSGAAN